MSKTIAFSLPSLLLLCIFLLLPETVSAQSGAGGFVPCSGSDCQACHFVILGQRVLNWLFGIIFVIFGVIAVVAGFGLVTSGGNQASLDAAKSKLSNAVIGVLIVFSAWLIVDTLLRAAFGGDDVRLGDENFGPWNEIRCNAGQTTPAGAGLGSVIDTYSGPRNVPAYATFVNGCTAAGGTPVVGADDPNPEGLVECRELPGG